MFWEGRRSRFGISNRRCGLWLRNRRRSGDGCGFGGEWRKGVVLEGERWLWRGKGGERGGVARGIGGRGVRCGVRIMLGVIRMVRVVGVKWDFVEGFAIGKKSVRDRWGTLVGGVVFRSKSTSTTGFMLGFRSGKGWSFIHSKTDVGIEVVSRGVNVREGEKRKGWEKSQRGRSKRRSQWTRTHGWGINRD